MSVLITIAHSDYLNESSLFDCKLSRYNNMYAKSRCERDIILIVKALIYYYRKHLFFHQFLILKS